MNHLDTLRRSIELTDSILAAGPIDAEAARAATACADFDVSALGEHIIDTHVFLLTAAGGSVNPSGDTLAERHRAVGPAAVAAWAAISGDDTVDLGGNQLPAAFGLALHALEAFVHGWDLANALDRSFQPDATLVEAAWDAAQTVISDDTRSSDAGAPYGPAVAISDSAPSLDRLIAFCGRVPQPRTAANA